MSDYFHMGGYAGYIWSSYALTFVILIAHVLVPLMRRKRIVREISRRIRREERQEKV